MKFAKTVRYGFLGLRKAHYLYVLHDNDVMEGVVVNLPRDTYLNQFYFASYEGNHISVLGCTVNKPGCSEFRKILGYGCGY